MLGTNSDPPYYDKNVRSLKRKGRMMSIRFKKTGTGGEKLNEVRKKLDRAKVVSKERFLGSLFDQRDVQGSWRRMYRYDCIQPKE